MSIDLDWAKLDSSLADRLVEILNRSISAASRPSFIGPITVTALEFGSIAPDIDIVDIRDVYRDFTECDSDEETGAVSGAEKGPVVDDEEYEWISRRAASRGMAQQAPSYHHLPPHLRYGPATSTELFNVPPPGIHSPTDAWNNRMSLPNAAQPYSVSEDEDQRRPASEPRISPPPREAVSADHADNPQPDLQLHLAIRHESDLRITVTTSLLINYPSPMFMALPIKLSVIGLVFQGQVVVAYEASRNRVHICIVDDMDPYGPVSDKRQPVMTTEAELPGQPLPIGHRLLPSIFIESEIGQADKHVLKNVTRIEKFLQEVIRKTVVDELVFPNFHTIVMGD